MKKNLWILFYILMWIVCIGHELFAETPEQIDFIVGGVTNSSGDPLAGGKIYTYQAGTTTPKATYQDSAKATPHANPVILDSEGKKLIFADGNYKLRIDNSLDVTQYTLDNLKYGKYGGGSSYAGSTTGSSNAYVATVSPALLAYDDGTVITFVANHTNTGASTLNVNGLGAKSIIPITSGTLAASTIISGQAYTVVYSSSNSSFMMLDAPSAYSSTLGTWTPTYSVTAPMTFTSTSTVFSKYTRIGKLIFMAVSFSGTVGGTPAGLIEATIPVAAVNQNISCATQVTDGGTIKSGSTTLGSSTSQIGIRLYDGAAYTAGTVGPTVYCFYEAAS